MTVTTASTTLAGSYPSRLPETAPTRPSPLHDSHFDRDLAEFGEFLSLGLSDFANDHAVIRLITLRR